MSSTSGFKVVSDDGLSWWSNAYILFSLLVSSLWGLTAVLFIPAGDVVYNMIVVVWMIGLSASAVSAYSAYMKAMLAFFLPVMFPAIIHLFVLGGQFNTAVAVACCIYVVAVLRAMMPISREMTRAISANFRLEDEIRERKIIEEKLREMSQQDGLTGLSNRHHFDEIIEAEWRRALRESGPLSLILMDIDYFKPFRDTYGHVEGDRCLREIGDIIQHVVRRSGDFPARYGGEELAIILPNTDLASAERIAETIRKSVQDLGIDHRGTEIKDCNVVTISAGVATIIPSRDTTPEQFIHTTDKAMYLAKEQCRNQVVTAN